MPGRSTTLQMLRTMYHWTEELDNGNDVDIVHIDFPNAFASVQYQRLLGTKDEYRVKGKAPNWIRAFLFGKKQRVIINESYSNWATVRSGLARGSVIGSVFFIISINSMFNCVSSKMYLYADYANLYQTVVNDEDAAQLQNDFDALWNGSQGCL